jgi:hypothetical protein
MSALCVKTWKLLLTWQPFQQQLQNRLDPLLQTALSVVCPLRRKGKKTVNNSVIYLKQSYRMIQSNYLVSTMRKSSIYKYGKVLYSHAENFVGAVPVPFC